MAFGRALERRIGDVDVQGSSPWEQIGQLVPLAEGVHTVEYAGVTVPVKVEKGGRLITLFAEGVQGDKDRVSVTLSRSDNDSFLLSDLPKLKLFQLDDFEHNDKVMVIEGKQYGERVVVYFYNIGGI